MKTFLRNIVWSALLFSTALSAYAVEVEIIDGTTNQALKQKIEENTAKLLTHINESYTANKPLNLKGLMTSDGQNSLEMLWENVHFTTEDSYIGERLLNAGNGYQIRNIAIEIQPQDKTESDERFKEAVISYDTAGNISSVYFALEQHMVNSILEKGIQLNDMNMRMQILDYVEHFRTSYNEKDLRFLNQVFSDDALIITGKVISSVRKTDVGISLPQVKYTSQNKQQYLDKLANVFKNNKFIDVQFEDVKIKRHGSNKNIYGVTVRQKWHSTRYSDDGYVFMVWDFSNPDAPQIHVRTWQPAYLDAKKSIPLPEDAIFDLNSIDGI